MVQLHNEPPALNEHDLRMMEFIEEWKQSGQSMSEWTKEREDITYYQLSRARRKLFPEEVYGTGKDHTWSAITMEFPSSSINVHLNGCRIEVPPGFDRSLLEEIVEVLKDAHKS